MIVPRRRMAILCRTGQPLTAFDLRLLAKRLEQLGWLSGHVDITTPLPPRDRRAVTIRVAAPTEGKTA